MTQTTPGTDKSHDTLNGFGFAVGAYFLWGFLPLYWKLLDHIPAAEVIAHRVIWSVPVATILLIILGRTADVRAALRSPRMLAMGAVTAALISVNWGVFIWAIAAERTLDVALGYYINPLVSVALGAIVLGEKLTRAQVLAVAVAVAAVVVLAIAAGAVPWVSIILTVSWAFYALAKKQLPIGPNQGFLLEVLVLLIPAMLYVAWLMTTGTGHFLAASSEDNWLLIGCGLGTAVPLILYANGAKGLQLATIGILQYIAPTLIALVAIFAFKEPIGQARMIAFPMIWAALIIYTASMFTQMRRTA